MPIKVTLENNALLAYKRLPYTAWYAIAEFVDNSTDVFLREGNHEALRASYEAATPPDDHLSIAVVWDRTNRILRITDNSMGMSLEDLENAFHIGEPQDVTAGRSEFGMGMKTAAVWFGDSVTVRTTKLGDPTEHVVTVDWAAFMHGTDEFEIESQAKSAETHYTTIEVSVSSDRRIHQSHLSKVKDYFQSMYRTDLRNGDIEISVEGEKLAPPPSHENADVFLKRQDGTPYVVQVDLSIDGGVGARRVRGWMGILGPNQASRNKAGFALIRFGRTIEGWIDSWHPEEIFGYRSNDNINQRLTGELHVDEFDVTHIKNKIDWKGNEQAELGERLRALCEEYDLLRVARTTKFREDVDEDGRLKPTDEDAARSDFEEKMTAAAMVDKIEMLDVPTLEMVKLANAPLLEGVEPETPYTHFIIGRNPERHAHVYLRELSPNDPYYEYEVQANADLTVVVNRSHPAFADIRSADGLVIHLEHVVFDAVAEWKCAQVHAVLEASSIRKMKDELFRASAEPSTEE